jgi:hypothetical protein
MVSGMCMSLSSVSVVVSSLLLQWYKKLYLDDQGMVTRRSSVHKDDFEPLLEKGTRMDAESQAPTPVMHRVARMVGVARKYSLIPGNN